MTTIFDISQKLQNDYETPVELAEGLFFDLPATNKQIKYISNSTYLDGNTDENGREIPYYNATNFRVNVAVRATDFDSKDVTIVSETADYVRSLLIGKAVENWMKESYFSKVMNRSGETRATFGWLMIKNLSKKGEPDIEVVNPSNLRINPCSPMDYPIKELHPDVTPAKLVEKRDVWDNAAIDQLLEMKEDKYEIAEITGMMPKSVDGGSETEFSMYRFFVYEGMDKEEGVVLYQEELPGKKLEDFYRYVAWQEIDGRTGRGIVEDMFEAQTWINEMKLLERDAVTLGGMTGFITDDDTLENNVLNDLDNGFIMKLDEGKTFQQVNTMTNALPAFEQVVESWDRQAEQITSTFEAVTGETLPSGTPFSSAALQNQEASSMFIYRREDMGIFWGEVFNEWIIPELIKKINREWIMSAEFTPEQLQKIDERFGTFRANEFVKERLINVDLPEDFTGESYEELIQAYQEIVGETDSVRFLEIPKDYFKDFKFKISVVTTNEQRNKAATLQSLSNIIGQVASSYNPQTGQFALLENPALASIFARAVELSGAGISPTTLNSMSMGSKTQRQIEAPKQRKQDEALTATESDQA